MADIGVGVEIYNVRKKIQEINSEIKSLGPPPKVKPELIDETNLLRSNEYYSKINDLQANLITAYKEYTKSLEGMLNTVFAIQNDLKDILKEQTKLLSARESKKRKTRK